MDAPLHLSDLSSSSIHANGSLTNSAAQHGSTSNTLSSLQNKLKSLQAYNRSLQTMQSSERSSTDIFATTPTGAGPLKSGPGTRYGSPPPVSPPRGVPGMPSTMDITSTSVSAAVGPSMSPRLAELQQKYSNIRQLRQDDAMSVTQGVDAHQRPAHSALFSPRQSTQNDVGFPSPPRMLSSHQASLSPVPPPDFDVLDSTMRRTSGSDRSRDWKQPNSPLFSPIRNPTTSRKEMDDLNGKTNELRASAFELDSASSRSASVQSISHSNEPWMRPLSSPPSRYRSPSSISDSSGKGGVENANSSSSRPGGIDFPSNTGDRLQEVFYSRLENLSRENDRLRDRAEKAERANEGLKSQILVLEERRAELLQRCSSLEAECAALQRVVGESIQGARQQETSSVAVVEQLQRERKDLENKFMERDAKLRVAEAELQSLRSALQQAQDGRAALQQELHELTMRLDTDSSHKARDHARMATELSRTQEENRSLQRRLDELASSHISGDEKRANSPVQDEFRAHRDTVISLNAQIASLHRQLESSRDDMNKEIRNLRDEKNQIQIEKAEVQGLLQSREVEIRNLQSRLNSQLNEFSRGANENRSLEEQIQEMQRRWNLERKDYQVLTDEYSRELAAAKANLQQTNNELIRLAAEIESMEGGRQQLLEQQALQNNSYEEAIQQLQSQVSSVRSQYASLEKELQSTRDRRSDAEREAQQLKTQIISSNMLHEAELQRMHIAHVSQQDAFREIQEQVIRSEDEHRNRLSGLQQENSRLADLLHQYTIALEEEQRRRSAMERAYNAPHFHDLPADILSELDHDNTLDLSSKRLRSQSEEASLEKMKTRLRDTESELERVRNELGEARKQLAVTEREHVRRLHQLNTECTQLQERMKAMERDSHDQLRKRQQRIDSLEEEVRVCRLELEETKARVSLQEEERDSAVSARKLVLSENRDLQQQIETIQREKTHQVSLLQKQLGNLQSEHNELYGKLQQVQREKSSEVFQLQGEISQYHGQIDALREECDRHRESLRQLQQEYSNEKQDYESELRIVREKLALNDRERDSLEARLDLIEGERSEVLDAISEEKRLANEKTTSLEKRYSRVEEALRVVNAQYETSQQELSRLKERIAGLSDEKEQLESESHNLRKSDQIQRNELRNLQERLQDKERTSSEEKRQHDRELENLRNRRSELESELRTINDIHQEQQRALRSEMQQMTHTYELLETEKQQMIDVLHQQLSAVQRENADLTESIAKMQHERIQLVQSKELKESEFQKVHGKLTDEHGKLRRAYDELKEAFSKKSRQWESEKVSLADKKSSAEKENEALRIALDDLRRKVESLQTDNSEMVTKLRRTDDLHSDTVIELRRQLSDTEQLLDQSQRQHASLRQAFDELQDRFATLNEEMASAEEEKAHQMKVLRDQVRRALEEKEVAQSECNTVKREREHVVADLERKVGELEQERDHSDRTLRQQIQGLKTDISHRDERLEERRREVDDLKSELSSARSKLNEINNALRLKTEDLERSKTSMQEKLDSLWAENLSLQGAVSSLKSDHESSSSEVVALQERFQKTSSRLQERIRTLEDENSMFCEKAQRLEMQNVELQGALTAAEERVARDREQYQIVQTTLSRERDELRARIGELSDRFEARENELAVKIRSLEDDNSRLELSIQSLEEIQRNQNEMIDRIRAGHAEELEQARAVAERRLKSAAMETAQAQEHLNLLNQQLTEVHTRNAQLLESSEKMKEQTEHRIYGLEKALEQLQSETQELALEYDNAVSKLKAFSYEFQAFRQHTETQDMSTAHDLSEFRTIMEKISAEREVMADEVESSRRQLGDLHSELEESRAQRGVLQQMNATLSVEIRTLKERMRTMEAELIEERELRVESLQTQQKTMREELDLLQRYLDDARKQHEIVRDQRSQLLDENARISAQVEDLRQQLTKQTRDHSAQLSALNEELANSKHTQSVVEQEKLRPLEKQMSETKKQAVMYEDRCRKAEREWNELKVRYEDMERKSQRQLQEMKSQCASDKEDLEAELRDLRRDFEFTSSSLHDTQEALDAVRRELTIAREELMRASHERENYVSGDAYHKLSEQLDESQALVRALQDDLRACKHRSEDAEIECETLRRKNREAEEELRGIRDTSQQREHSTQLTVHQLSSQLKQMQEMIDSLTSQRRQLQEDKSALAKRVEEMLGSERERSKYQESVLQEIEESRAERAKFEAMAMEYREKRDLVHQKYLEYKERCVELEEELQSAQIARDHAERELSERLLEIEHRSGHVEGEQFVRSRLEGELHDTQRELEHTRKINVSIQSELDEVKRRLHAAADEGDHFASQHFQRAQQLTKELAAIQKDYENDRQQWIVKLQILNQEKSVALGNFQVQISALEQQNRSLIEQKRSVDELNSTLQQQRRSMQQEISRLQQEIQKQLQSKSSTSVTTYLNATIESMQKRARELETENQSLTNRIEALQHQQEDLEQTIRLKLTQACDNDSRVMELSMQNMKLEEEISHLHSEMNRIRLEFERSRNHVSIEGQESAFRNLVGPVQSKGSTSSLSSMDSSSHGTSFSSHAIPGAEDRSVGAISSPRRSTVQDVRISELERRNALLQVEMERMRKAQSADSSPPTTSSSVPYSSSPAMQKAPLLTSSQSFAYGPSTHIPSSLSLNPPLQSNVAGAFSAGTDLSSASYPQSSGVSTSVALSGGYHPGQFQRLLRQSNYGGQTHSAPSSPRLASSTFPSSIGPLISSSSTLTSGIYGGSTVGGLGHVGGPPFGSSSYVTSSSLGLSSSSSLGITRSGTPLHGNLSSSIGKFGSL